MLSDVLRPFFFVIISFGFLFFSCTPRAVGAPPPDKADRAAAARARELVSKMSDSEAAAQVLLTAAEGSASLSRESAELLSALPAGGVMLFKYNLGKGADAARRLTDAIRATVSGPVPPFIAADQEGGSVHRFGADATKLPPAAAFGSIERSRVRSVAEGAAFRSGRELSALGVTLNLAPVAEVSDEKSTLFLGDRAYGNDPTLVADAASGFIEGMRRAGVACVVKHFPGNAAADPHKARAVIQAEGAALDRLIEPFRLVFVRSQPAAVMVSHAVIAAIDPSRPATLSPLVIDGLLRKKLGYRGLAVSDDLRMKAITATGLSPAQAAPLAINAGIDLVMTWPLDAAYLRDSLVDAVASGQLSRDRLREAAARVVAVKIRYGLIDPPPAARIRVKDINIELAALKKETANYLRTEGLR
ncbi:MAG: glycoside hydrolase family 3 N-terminal domain-containing protein [Treponemataceae bacterium]